MARAAGWLSPSRPLASLGAGLRRAGGRALDRLLVLRASRAEAGRIPAIVLTCDRYHPFAGHMVARYQALWPSHPFTFHVPYQRRPLAGDRIVPRQTPEAIRATVLALLEGFDDEAWVYWCMDDRYPIALVQPSVGRLADAVRADRLAGIDGLLFCRCRRLLRRRFLLSERRAGPGGVALRRRRDYSQIWIHQFLRAKALRHLFESMPEALPVPRAMDAVKDHLPLPADHRLYVVETNLAVFGESTRGGLVTRNCAASLRAAGLGLPPGFEETDREVLLGALPPDQGPAAEARSGP